MNSAIVLGAGVMGTAFALPLSDRGIAVRLIGTHLDRELVAGMKRDRVHGRLKAPIGDNIAVFDDREMAEAFAEPAELVIVGVSTPGVDWAVELLAEHDTGDAPIVLLTKGIARATDRVEILPDYMARQFAENGVAHGPIGAVGGPCIAGELAVRRATSAAVAFRDRGLAERLAGALSTPYYQLRATDDLVGLEICAALKNFYAIGVGTAAGRLESSPTVNNAALHNLAASLFNQAVTELARIVTVSSGRTETAYGLAGVGDLHVTCQAGRNSRLGRLLGAGMRYSEAMEGPLAGETVEGTLVAEALQAPLDALAAAGRLDRDEVPLARAIIDAITGDTELQVDLSALHRAGVAA